VIKLSSQIKQEMYYKIKDKINIYQQGTLYKVECPFCKKGSHFAD